MNNNLPIDLNKCLKNSFSLRISHFDDHSENRSCCKSCCNILNKSFQCISHLHVPIKDNGMPYVEIVYFFAKPNENEN